MDGFNAAYLANLLANLSAQIIPKAERRFRKEWQGPPAVAALQRCLQAGILMMVSKASTDVPEEEGLLEDIFNDFFAHVEVAIHLMNLLYLKPLNMDELAYLFAEAGYDAATLPGLRFDEAMTAFEVAFLEQATLEPTLQPIIQVHQGWAQTDLQRQMVSLMQRAVELLKPVRNQPLAIRDGSIVVEDRPGNSPTINARDINNATNVVSGVQQIENQFIFQWQGQVAAVDNSARTSYLNWLLQERQTLSIRAISAGKTGGQRRPPELAQVYVALNTTGRALTVAEGAIVEPLRAMALQDDKPLSAIRALALNQRLVLLGDPGSGKSTFVSHLAYCLAAHTLYPTGNWLKRLPDWPAERANLLPLFVVLRDFARWLPTPLPERAYPHHLWDFITSSLAKERLEAVLPILERGLANGQVLLLLDGLDEVTNLEQRRFVRDATLVFSRRYADCPLLVTCRVLSYQPPDPEKEEEDLRLLPTDAYPPVELAPFNEAQRNDFIHAWYGELKRLGHLPGLDEERLSQDLQWAIRRSDLQRMAGNPLLLTVMAMVHAEEGRLPDSRALLYNKAVDLLLLRWEESKGEDEISLLRHMLQQANRTELDLKSRLAEVAFHVHTQTGAIADDGQVSDVDETYLCQELSRLHKKNLGWGQQLLDVIKTRAGLLIERSPGQFAFPHRTFQEYLAGAYLAAQPDFAELALEWARRDVGWWPMLLFAVEHLVYVSERPRDPLFFISELCPVKAVPTTPAEWRQVWLAGDVLLSLGQERAEDSKYGQQLLECVQQQLAALINGGHLTPRERAEAGKVLARLGDGRRGVGLDANSGLPDILWSDEIPAGMYTIGDNEGSYEDEQTREVRLTGVEVFHLACYPITNAQFQSFIDAPDGDNPDWWEGMPEDEKQFSQPRWSYANHPRETVSWYQAVAFCKWLTAKLHGGLLPNLPVAPDEVKKYVITLPHEYEWEVAARWPNKDMQERIYPWGPEFEPTKANTSEGGIRQTTAVGMYPSGKNAALDLHDLSGNVWEWCRNRYDEPDGDQDPEKIDMGSSWRVLRGGSFFGDRSLARAGFRYQLPPDGRSNHDGFRVVVRRPPSHQNDH